MKEVQITASDDRIFADTGQRVEADTTLYIAIGTDPRQLKVRELDLTKDNAGQCLADVQPWADAGHDPGAIGPPAPSGDGPGHHSVAAMDYNQRMRAWCDKTGFKPGYRKMEKGGYYYPLRLKQAYAAYLTGLAQGNGLIQGDELDPAARNAAAGPWREEM